MNKLRAVIIALVLAGISIGAQAQDTATPEFPEPGSYTAYVDVDGVEREYRIYIPESYPTSAEAVPLVIGLHGSNDSGRNFEHGTGLSLLSEVYGYIAVYPDSVDGFWNAGQSVPEVPHDDIAFMRDIVDDMADLLNIDTARIYVTGFSMGGMMSYRIACEMRDTVAAVAAVGAPLPRFVRPLCTDAAPMPIAVIHGLDDTVVPAEGDRTSYFSIDETLRFWVLTNECEQKADTDTTFSVSPLDGESAHLRQFTQCADDTEVSVYTVEGGGHSWFGVLSSRDLPRLQAGNRPENFGTALAVVDFFYRHTLDKGGDD